MADAVTHDLSIPSMTRRTVRTRTVSRVVHRAGTPALGMAVIGCIGLTLPLPGVERVADAQVSVGSSTYLSESLRRRPLFTRVELDVFVRALELDGPARAAAENIYEAFLADWRAEEREMRLQVADQLEEMELMQDNSAGRSIGELRDGWRRRADELEQQLLDDIAALLTHDQERLWPIAEREIRRRKQIVHGKMGGEFVDVIRLVDEMIPVESITDEIGAILEDYARDMDGALVRRDRFIGENREGYPQLAREDPDRAETIFNQARRLRQAIVEVNERAIRRVAAELPEEFGERLTEAYEREGYRIYLQPSRLERQLETIDTHIRMDAEQRGRYVELLHEYRTRLAAIHRREIEERRRMERHDTPRFLLIARTRGTDEERTYANNRGWAHNPTLTSIRRDRLALDRWMRSSLNELLTAQQRLALPDQAGEPVYHYGQYGDYASL